MIRIVSTLAVFVLLCHADEEISVKPPGDIWEAENSDITLTCAVKFPNNKLIGEIKWLDPNNRTIDDGYISHNGNHYSVRKPAPDFTSLLLRLLNLQKHMQGNYTCVVTYNNQQFVKSTKVQIFMPISFLNAPEDQLAKQWQKNFKLKCEVQADFSPRVSWERNGEQIENGEKYIQKEDGLVINNINESDDGDYVCIVDVSETGKSKRKTIHLEVISDPKIEPTLPDQYNVTEGEKAEIQCNATGKPIPNISWIKTRDQKNLTTEFGGKLIIDRVTKEHDDIFRCVASNKANRVEKEVKFNVLSKPDIIEFINGSFAVGQDGEISCSVHGNPEPNITIRKLGNMETNDVRISLHKSNDPRRFKTVKAVLKFTKIQRSDDGLYECVAENGIGETIRNLHLMVQFKPTFENSGLVNRYVSWNQQPRNLTCIAQAIPNATITWHYGQDPISLDKHLQPGYKIFGLGWKSILQVTPRESRYYGPYRCKAVNPYGEAFYDIKLDEGKLPDPIPSAKENTTTATTVTFDFGSETMAGNLPIKAYIVEYFKEGEDSSRNKKYEWPFGGPYILEKLNSSTKYVFKFAVINEVGIGPWGSFLSVQTPDVSPPSEPVINAKPGVGEQFIQSPFAEHIEIRWNIPSSNGPEIERYTVLWCQLKFENNQLSQADECTQRNVPYTKVLSSYMVEGLKSNSYYRVMLTAHNSQGDSVASERFYRTSATTEMSEKMEADGVSSGAILFVIIVVLISLLIILDVFCCFIGKTGMMYFIFGKFCIKKKKHDDKIGSENRDLITNGHRNKIDVEEQSPMIADSGKKNTAVEFNINKGISKTGIVGKDSSV